MAGGFNFFRWLLKPRQFAGPAPQNVGQTGLKGQETHVHNRKSA
jgi:hypothetical protein